MQTMEDLGIKSPPRPQRILGQLSSQASLNYVSYEDLCLSNSQSSQPKPDIAGNFQAQLVDRSVTAIPGVFTEVFSMQKSQSNELNKQQTLLDDLKEQVSRGECKKDELQQEISWVKKRIFKHEEGIKDNNKTIRALDTDIQTLVVKLNDKEAAVRQKKVDIEFAIRKLEKQTEKSEEFKQKVIEFEKESSEVYHQIQEVKERIKALKDQECCFNKDEDQKERLLSGKMEEDIQVEIECMQAKIVETENDTEGLKKQVAEEESRQKKLKQTLQVLEKRNAAQLTRLKRQVKELQVRNRHRQTQVSHLAEKVTEARSMIQPDLTH